MNRLLLLIENKSNRNLLKSRLGERYEVLVPEDESPLDQIFDACLVDGPMLQRYREQIQARKVREQPLFLPCVLVTLRRDLDLRAHQLWQSIDTLIHLPVHEQELLAQMEILFRTRQMSHELKLRNEDLQSFIYAMSHDLRAPLRAIQAYTWELQVAEEARANLKEKHYLKRIIQIGDQMQELIEALLSFCRLGHEKMQLQLVPLDLIVEKCLSEMKPDLEQVKGEIVVEGPNPIVRAYPALLKVVLVNLLRNACKFVAPGVTPVIKIAIIAGQDRCRIEIQDNGIGIAPEDQARLFTPFTQLHGQEEYPGVGLGLATVRKAVEQMGGSVGVISCLGKGSTFWIEVPLVNEVHYAYSRD